MRPNCLYPNCWHRSSKCGFCKDHLDEGLAALALLKLSYTKQ